MENVHEKTSSAKIFDCEMASIVQGVTGLILSDFHGTHESYSTGKPQHNYFLGNLFKEMSVASALTILNITLPLPFRYSVFYVHIFFPSNKT